MRRYPGRAVTVLLGIALGAAVFTGVRLSVHASVDAFSQGVEYINGKTQWTVARPGGRIPEHLIAKLLQLPFVQSASPVLSAYVQSDAAETGPFLLIGFDPILERSVRDWQIESSRAAAPDMWLDLMTRPGTLIVGESLWRKFSHGDPVLEYRGRKKRFHILGSLKSDGVSLIEGGHVAVTDISTFQEFTGLYGVVDRVDLVLTRQVSHTQLQEIRNRLPGNIELDSPTDAGAAGYRMIRAYQLNLTVLSFVSLFVGMYLVYSLIALNAASRRRELAVIRSVGGSPRLLFSLFLGEGVLFGIAGWGLSLPISTFLVKWFLKGVSQTISTLFVRIQVDRLTLDSGELLFSFVVTVLICAAAAWQPAREAMRVDPHEALEMTSHIAGPRSSGIYRRLAVIGAVCIAAIWPLSCLPGYSGLPLPGYAAVFLMFVGFSLPAPWCLKFAGTRTFRLLRRIGGETAGLSVRYVRDSGIRIAVSVGALITAVALFTSIAVMVHSFRETVRLWVDQTISGDLFVRPKMAEINRYRDPMSIDSVRQIKHLSSDVDLMPYQRYYLTYAGTPYQFETLDFKMFRTYGSFFWVQGDPETAREMLSTGRGVAVSEVFSNRTGLRVGDMFDDVVDDLRVQVPITGIVRDYRTNGGIVYYSFQHFNRLAPDITSTGLSKPEKWGGVRMFFRDRSGDLDARVDALKDRLATCCSDELEMISGRGLRTAIMNIFDETFSITTILLVISLVVAGMGMAVTLAVLVMQRTREFNTLIAIGAARGQIRSMILWEAFLMVTAGEIAGLMCGFLLSWLLVYVINYQSFGWTFLYRVDWGALFMSVPLIILTAILSALPAMHLVFRRSPATLLREK